MRKSDNVDIPPSGYVKLVCLLHGCSLWFTGTEQRSCFCFPFLLPLCGDKFRELNSGTRQGVVLNPSTLGRGVNKYFSRSGYLRKQQACAAFSIQTGDWRYGTDCLDDPPSPPLLLPPSRPPDF
ncbi:hypothetical protein Q5P01_008765 [Channa striata]|uniref:Uncharacterized protein n=1 Tax=Channa striata TaxID=64152 RepID=A0AA88MZY1_CHASR|nr:hypothetical protein Q5P01_008765 [Channa striata]